MSNWLISYFQNVFQFVVVVVAAIVLNITFK